MNAEIVSIGTELLLGSTIDSNSAALGKILATNGIDHLRRQTVGDNFDRMVESLQLAASRSDIVFTIGGLGPTEDDLTRKAIAHVSGRELEYSEEVEKQIRELLKRRGREFRDSQINQCYSPRGAEMLDNPEGTAPGIWLDVDGTLFVALPGPPREFLTMLREYIEPRLKEMGENPIAIRVVRVTGLGESDVEAAIAPMLKSENPTVATYAKSGEVHIRLAVRSADPESSLQKLADAEIHIRKVLGANVYGVDEETLEEVVLERLVDLNSTVATAESCTGGRIASRITGVTGSGDAFLGGVVSYAEGAKVQVLGVGKEVISKHGAVSHECARAMAEGASKKFGADYAISVTGFAGPTGGTDEDPIGTVYIGLASPDGVNSERHWFPGSRSTVQDRATQAALDMLYFELVETRPIGD